MLKIQKIRSKAECPPKEEEQHSNPPHDHAATRLVKTMTFPKAWQNATKSITQWFAIGQIQFEILIP